MSTCGPRSSGVKTSDFWVIYVDADVQGNGLMQPLPLLTIHLTSTCRTHDGLRPVSCAFDGDVGSVCLVESPDVLLSVDCSDERQTRVPLAGRVVERTAQFGSIRPDTSGFAVDRDNRDDATGMDVVE